VYILIGQFFVIVNSHEHRPVLAEALLRFGVDYVVNVVTVG